MNSQSVKDRIICYCAERQVSLEDFFSTAHRCIKKRQLPSSELRLDLWEFGKSNEVPRYAVKYLEKRTT